MNNQAREHTTFFSSLKQVRENKLRELGLINNMDKLRRFRNKLVHSPKNISEKDISPYMELLSYVNNEIKSEANK